MTLVRFKNPNHKNYFPSILDSFLNDDFFNLEKNVFSPATNVKETEHDFKLEILAPGFEKEHFNIALENGTISISAELKEESEKTDEKMTRKEFQIQAFKRSFTLPENIDEDQISANYKQGVLHVTLPKMATKEIAAKKISIN